MIYVAVVPVVQPVSIPMTYFFQPADDEPIYIQANVSSSQEFTERVPVIVHAVGSIGPQYVDVLNVCLCFSGAYYLDFNGQPIPNPNREPFAGADLSVTTTRPSENVTMWFGGAYLVGFDATIEWLAPTESVPTIIVTYRNTTLVNGIVQNTFASERYPAKSLHIESFATIESSKTTLKLLLIGAVAIPISFLEVILLIIDRREKRKKRIIT